MSLELIALYEDAMNKRAAADLANDDAHEAEKAYIDKMMQEKHGVTLGETLVVCTKGSYEGVVFRSRNISMWDLENAERDGRPWLTGYRHKKDGSFSDRVSNLYTDWKVADYQLEDLKCDA